MKKLLCSSIFLVSSAILASAITDVTAGAGATGTYDIVFKNANVQPASFNTNQPASIVLDFPNTSSSLPKRAMKVNQNGIFSINVIPGNGNTRAVINLAFPTRYTVTRVGKDVYVRIPQTASRMSGGASAASGKSAPMIGKTAAPVATGKRIPLSPASPRAKSAAVSSVQKIQQARPAFDLTPMFHRNGATGGRLSFTLPSEDTRVDVNTQGSSIVATISGYAVPKNAQKRLDVADYGSPVHYVDIIRKRGDTEIRLDMGRNGYDYVSYQNDRTYTIEVSKPDLSDADRIAKELTGFGPGRKYNGEPLSLNFQDIEVRAVLQIIAEFIDQNIVVSDSVKGNITLRLNNVPWDQALDIILKTKSLAMRKNGSVVYIAPENELNKSEIDALADWQKKQQLIPSRTELIQVKYAKASDLAQIIEKSRDSSKGVNGINRNQDTILSAKGSVSVDKRTNTLLVSDIPSKIQAVRDLVVKLDEPVRQVLIDSRLVITSDNFSRNIGSRLGLTFFGKPSDRVRVAGSGTLQETSHTFNDRSIFRSKEDAKDEDLSKRLGVRFPAQGSSLDRGASYALSIIGSDVLVDLELQALQNEGRSEILSSPRVVTQDGYKALVSSGQEIPYSTVSDEGTDTEFKDAKLSMEVTPRIAPNDRVSMEIHITKDNPDFGNLVNGEPPLDTNEIDTRVEVENGETIVLGGIYEQTQSTSTDKVPLLGDIPLVGNLFKSTAKQFNKEELLIFITPRIIDQRLSSGDKFSNLRN